ncbi:hypothetical protein Tco_1390006, partial [Tanacetum coccineum]
IPAFVNVADVERSNTPEVKVDNVGHVRGSSIEDVKVSGEDNVVQTMREKRIMFIDVGESSVAEVGGSCGDKVVQKKGKRGQISRGRLGFGRLDAWFRLNHGDMNTSDEN